MWLVIYVSQTLSKVPYIPAGCGPWLPLHPDLSARVKISDETAQNRAQAHLFLHALYLPRTTSLRKSSAGNLVRYIQEQLLQALDGLECR